MAWLPDCEKISKISFIFCLRWGRSCGNHAKRYINEKTIQCLPNASQHVAVCLQQFPSYSNRKCKKSPFSRNAAHIFVSPGDAPAIITQYVPWMERQFNACQSPRSIYLSIFNGFRVIRCLSQCVNVKIAIFTTFLFPLGTPLGQSRKTLHKWKDNSVLAKTVAACTIFNSFPVIRTASAKKSPFSRTAAHIFVSPGDAPATITQYVPWMERQLNAC